VLAEINHFGCHEGVVPGKGKQGADSVCRRECIIWFIYYADAERRS
jgi:hypothetical protein